MKTSTQYSTRPTEYETDKQRRLRELVFKTVDTLAQGIVEKSTPEDDTIDLMVDVERIRKTYMEAKQIHNGLQVRFRSRIGEILPQYDTARSKKHAVIKVTFPNGKILVWFSQSKRMLRDLEHHIFRYLRDYIQAKTTNKSVLAKDILKYSWFVPENLSSVRFELLAEGDDSKQIKGVESFQIKKHIAEDKSKIYNTR